MILLSASACSSNVMCACSSLTRDVMTSDFCNEILMYTVTSQISDATDSVDRILEVSLILYRTLLARKHPGPAPLLSKEIKGSLFLTFTKDDKS